MLSKWKQEEPTCPYFAVIFISKKSSSLEGYEEMDNKLMTAAHRQPGFLGYSSSGNPKEGIFISYWQDEDSIELWRNHSTHFTAKQQAYDQWYDYFQTMICKVESSKTFLRDLTDDI